MMTSKSMHMTVKAKYLSAHQLGLHLRPPVELDLRLLTLHDLGRTPSLLVLGPLDGMGHALCGVLGVSSLLLLMVGNLFCILVGQVDGLLLQGHGLAGVRSGPPVPLLGEFLLVVALLLRILLL